MRIVIVAIVMSMIGLCRSIVGYEQTRVVCPIGFHVSIAESTGRVRCLENVGASEESPPPSIWFESILYCTNGLTVIQDGQSAWCARARTMIHGD